MNTLLITVDALRPDHLPEYGYQRDTTGCLSEILAGCHRFENAFSNGVNTVESLSTMFTGKYHGFDEVRTGPTIASVLRKHEIRTCGLHSNVFLSHYFDEIEGFDHYSDFNIARDVSSDDSSSGGFIEDVYDLAVDLLKPYFRDSEMAKQIHNYLVPNKWAFDLPLYVDAEQTTDAAVSWLNDSGREDFFLWVHYMDTHQPYGKDSENAFSEDLAPEEIKKLTAKAKLNPGSVTESERQSLINLYDSDIQYTSKHVARLIQELKERGLWAETNVILTSDHGEEFAEHGLYFHRNRPYDELIRVPLFVRAPEHDGRVIRHQKPLLDIPTTICGFHGVEPPNSFVGESVLEPGSRKVITTGNGRKDDDTRVIGVRWKQKKYMNLVGQKELVFDLGKDPSEENPRKGDFPEYRKLVPERLLTESVDYGTDGLTGSRKKQLESLGYI